MAALEPITVHFAEAHPEDAARVLEISNAALAAEFLGSLSPASAARVLRHMTPDGLARCLDKLEERAAPIVGHLPVAIASPALRGLDARARRRLMDALPKTVSVPLGLALRFPEGSVGALLDPQAASVQQEMTVGETIQIARRAPELLRRYVYVLDATQQLVGVLDVRECLLAPRDAIVRSLMARDPSFLRARTSVSEAAADPAWLQFDVLPVVGQPHTFLGVLRRRVLDAAMRKQVAREEAEPGLGSTLVDLANVYWQMSTAMFLGQREARSQKRER